MFVAVAEHKSFTRGADALGLTTSAAGMQVQALEEYLRLPLFRRNGRQVELTSEGERLHSSPAHYFVCLPALLALEKVVVFGNGWQPKAHGSLRHPFLGRRSSAHLQKRDRRVA